MVMSLEQSSEKCLPGGQGRGMQAGVMLQTCWCITWTITSSCSQPTGEGHDAMIEGILSEREMDDTKWIWGRVCVDITLQMSLL